MNKLQRTGELLIPSIAYGDAAGFPLETKSYRFIAHAHGEINQLIETVDGPFDGKSFPAGHWTDDTQLSIAVANSLIRANQFSLPSVVDTHIDAYNETEKIKMPSGRIRLRGWGGSTTRSMQRIIEDNVSPFVSGEKDGSGNGILMKMASLAYWQVARNVSDAERYRQYDQLTTMTHDGDVSRVCTRVHGDVLKYLLTEEFSNQTFIDIIAYSASRHEQALGAAPEVSKNLAYLSQSPHPTSEEILAQYNSRAEGLTDKEFGFKYGFHAAETLALAYGAFLKADGDFHRSVYGAVNLGGDTDSTASIAAAMVNFAARGEYELPVDFNEVNDLDRLFRVSRTLAAKALEIA